MQRKDLSTQLKNNKFFQDGNGRVTDKAGREYFILGAKSVISLDSDPVKYGYDDISRITFETYNDEHSIVVRLNDGNRRKFKGLEPDDVADITIRNMPLEVSDLNDVFDILYPDADEMLYYDLLKEKVMVDGAMFGMSDGIIPLNDNVLAHYHDSIERRFDEENFLGQTSPSYQIRDEALMMQANMRSRNPFREWMESHIWDGKPRVRTWFIELVGATAPPLADLGDINGVPCEQVYLESVAEAWFMGAVARQYETTKVEIVPVLISGQGIGKGNAIRYTAGQDQWFIDTNVDIRKPDRFLDSVRGRVIVELSEATQLRGPDSETLKSFISQEEDQLRKAYARNESVFPRHFVMIASSNLDNLFTDVTGNRRYFPFYCDPSKSTRTFDVARGEDSQYEVEQLWAEALQMYRDGHVWYLQEEVAQLADLVQQYASVDNPGIEAIDAVLDQIHPNIGDLTSRQEILQKVFSVPAGAPCPKEYENNYRAWANGTRNWKKITTNKRINGKVTKGFQRVALPGETPKVERLKMKRSTRKSVGNSGLKDPVKAWFKAVVMSSKIKSTEEFYLKGAPKANLKYLESIGLIYRMDTRDGEPIYRTLLGYDSPDSEWEKYEGATASE